MSSNKTILIDVRTPAEFSTGFLSTNNTDAINIEYERIEELPTVLSKLGIELFKSDPVTLYCRSGRRSNIALQTLKGLGYQNVRDIGGYEDARAILQWEDAVRVVRESKEESSGTVEGESRAASNWNKEDGLKGYARLVAGLEGAA